MTYFYMIYIKTAVTNDDGVVNRLYQGLSELMYMQSLQSFSSGNYMLHNI